MTDHRHQFAAAMAAEGLSPPDLPKDDGVLRRFTAEGDRPGSNAAWYCLHGDGVPAGAFGSWRTGEAITWSAKPQAALTPGERQAQRDRILAARKARQRAQEQTWAQAAARAQSIWNGAVVSLRPQQHPYVAAKGIHPHRIRLHRGSIVLPLQDFAGNLRSLQFIAPDGRKVLLSAGRKRGCFIHVAGDLEAPRQVLIAEGWATACTLIVMAPRATILAAVDAGNLEPVAVGARQRWPDVPITVAGDDDRRTPGNPGATKARAAAVAARARLALPKWPPGAPLELSDFNDLQSWERRGPHDKA